LGSGGEDVSSNESIFLNVGVVIVVWLDGSSSKVEVSSNNQREWNSNVKSSSSLVDDVLSNRVSSHLIEVSESSSNSESSFNVSSSSGEVIKNDSVKVVKALLSRVSVGKRSEGWVQRNIGLSGSKAGEFDTANPNISSSRWGWVGWKRNEEKGSADSKVGSNSVSFSSKDVQVVVRSNRESQVSSNSSVGQIDCSRFSSMNSSKIECQSSVDKYPQVIISSESEGLCSLKSELGVDFSGEVEVVSRVSVVSKSLSIDGEVVGVIVNIDSRVGGSLCQGDGLGESLVDSSSVSVPLRESGSRSDFEG